ncbi:MAG TPA: VOC family protein, partial [Burkholderiales bacterium]|nr:VOC family protein [Burkholderiales bacterium]
MQPEFDLGGVRWPRPFRIRRLGHFGVNVADPERSKDFYCRLLGFRVSDPLDFAHRLPEEKRANVGPTVGYFARHGTDHHSFVFFPKGAYQALNPWAARPQGTVNQITWQVGS